MSSLEDLQPEIGADRVAELHASGEVQLVDVREPHEHEAGHIAGARHVPFAQLSGEAASLDRARPIVFVCRAGGRSAVATQAFRASGFDAHNMTGGMLDWVDRKLPLEPPDGSIADH